MAISSTTMRLTGLVSGMDTDTIVKNLMQIEQLKVNRQIRAKTTYEWKQEALNGINSDLKSFMNTFISTVGSSSMMNSNNYIKYDVAVSGSNASAVTVKANSAASAGSLEIKQVVSLAKAASAKSAASVSKNGQLSEGNYAKLGDIASEFANELQFDDSGNISFSINDVEFTFNKDTTLQTMMTTINNSDAGVTMSYSRLTDKISFTSKETGKDTSVNIVNISGNAFGANSAFGIAEGKHEGGSNAVVIIDDVTVEKTSNTFSIDGITYTLNKTTEVDDEPITITLTQNVDDAVDAVKKFVDGYNTLISKIDNLLAERKTTSEKSYTALTDDEKADMTEDQIKAWEEIAKKGILYGDSALRGMLSSLRGALYSAVESAGLSPSQIGIKTGDWTQKGQIVLDEDALRAALQKDPSAVMNVFMASSETDKYSETGLLNRINDIMNSYMKGSGQTALDSLETSIKNVSDKIDTMQEKMEALMEKYYLKFAAMEEALSKLNSQSDWLASMLGTSS